MSLPHNSLHPAVTLSVRIPPESRNQLEELANATGRSKSFLASEAIKHYLAMHSWQVKAIEKSIKKANSKKAKFITHKKVADWLNSWDSGQEQEPPR